MCSLDREVDESALQKRQRSFISFDTSLLAEDALTSREPLQPSLHLLGGRRIESL
jgi:hypothetical protein